MAESQRIEVLYDDNHLLAVNKPANLPTMGVSDDRASLLTIAKRWVAETYDKPGNVYLGIVSRLDAPVTGVVLLARTSKAAARLSEAFRTRRVDKRYLAVVEGEAESESATLEHYLRKDERHRQVHVTHEGSEGAQVARLSYAVLARRQGLSLLEVTLETGRKHQIRVQLAKAGLPIFGDLKYGGRMQMGSGIGLHARSISLEHPVRREPLSIEAPLPPAWRRQRGIAVLLDA